MDTKYRTEGLGVIMSVLTLWVPSPASLIK
jgi:hypothetical protein